MGKKYGEPRRSAQEVIRSECAWSEEAEQAINKRLDELESLTKTGSPGATPNTPLVGDSSVVSVASPLNLRIQVCICVAHCMSRLVSLGAGFFELSCPCRSGLGAVDDGHVAVHARMRLSFAWCVCVPRQASIVQLRDLVYKRACFLEALLPTPPRRNIAMAVISVTDDPPTVPVTATVDAPPAKTFNSGACLVSFTRACRTTCDVSR